MTDKKISFAGSGTDRETEPVTVDVSTDFSATRYRTLYIPPRNAPCTCGSGHKFKKCCYLANHERDRQQRLADDLERRARWEEQMGSDRPRRVSPATMALIAMAGMAETGRGK